MRKNLHQLHLLLSLQRKKILHWLSALEFSTGTIKMVRTNQKQLGTLFWSTQTLKLPSLWFHHGSKKRWNGTSFGNSHIQVTELPNGFDRLSILMSPKQCIYGFWRPWMMEFYWLERLFIRSGISLRIWLVFWKRKDWIWVMVGWCDSRTETVWRSWSNMGKWHWQMITLEQEQKWIQELIKKHGYEHHNIFNMDETGLYYG